LENGVTSKERVLAALKHKQPDHTPLWHGVPKKEVMDGLFQHYQVRDEEALLRAIGDDFRWAAECGWRHPERSDPWPFKMAGANPAACETVAQVDALPWPDPKYVHVSGVRERCQKVSDCAIMGGSWAPFFHEIGWIMGQEEYLVKMYTHPAVVEAFTEHVVDFHLAANERVFQVAGDLMDFYFFGNDFGTQRGLLISVEHFRRFVLPGVRRLAEQAHSYGLHVWLHSCGSVRAIIPDLIDVGVEALHPVQVSAAGMSAEELGREFRGKLMFIGGIDVHHLLREGTPEEVRQAVRHNKRHLCPGYAVSPSHEAVLPDVPIPNLVAMFDEAKK
jgi:uroporphyrinogen decarboxylase